MKYLVVLFFSIFTLNVIAQQEVLKLKPDSAHVWPWTAVVLNIIRDSSKHSVDAYRLYGRDGMLKSPEWTVNGIVNGDYYVGTITTTPQLVTTYLSPSTQPAKNPVEIIATFKDVLLNGQYGDQKIVCHIDVVEGFWMLKLEPISARLSVNEPLQLKLFLQHRNPDPKIMVMGNPPTATFGSAVKDPVKWTVNGIVNGNEMTGQITDFNEWTRTVTYVAPSTIPANNPVSITAICEQIYLTERIVDTAISSNIVIYDRSRTNSDDSTKVNAGSGGNGNVKDGKEVKPDKPNPNPEDSLNSEIKYFQVTMVSIMDAAAGSVLGRVTYRDSGSFMISIIGQEARVSEIVNKNLPDKLDYKGKCKVTQLKPGSGLIHVGGIASIKYIPGSSPSLPGKVDIQFSRTPVILPLLQFVCPNLNKRGTYTSTNGQAISLAASVMPAFPLQIQFVEKEEEQTILKIGDEGGEMYVKFTVRQITR